MTLKERIGIIAAAFKGTQTVMSNGFGALVKPFGSFYSNEMDFNTAVNDGYKALVWVYRCVNAYQTAVSSVPWKVYKRGGKEETHVPNHPLETLLNRPNRFFGRKEFFDTYISQLFLGGCAYWEKVLVRKLPVELWNIRPDWMTPVPDETLFIRRFDFKAPGMTRAIPYDPDEVVLFRFIDPADPHGHLSPLTAASKTMQTEAAAVKWNKSMLDNAAVPGGLFKIPATQTTKEQRDELRVELKKQFTEDRRFSTMVLWGGMEWEKLGLSPADMQFLEQRRLNKYEICSIFGVPPQMVGAQEDPTYSNYAVARLSWWEDSVIPVLVWTEDKINNEITPLFGDNIICRYDLTNVPAMREALAQKVNTAFKMWQMRWPLNTIDRRLGLGMGRVPWGDVAFEQINMAPIDTLEELQRIDTAPPPTTTDPKKPDPDTAEE